MGKLEKNIENSCLFTGHRTVLPEKLNTVTEKLKMEINWMLSHGICNFYTGGALGFDTLAALSVLEAREHDPRVKLILAIPCMEQYKYWKPDDIEVYKYIFNAADERNVLSNEYHRGVMHIRNKYMVENCSYCICFYDEKLVEKSGGKHGKGTLETVNYAKKKGLKIINICDVPPDDGQLEFDFDTDFKEEIFNDGIQ